VSASPGGWPGNPAHQSPAAFNFTGWNTNISGGASTVFDQNTKVYAATPVYAQWGSVNTTKFTVKFNTDGGNPPTISDIEVLSGATIGNQLPQNPSKTENGKIFDFEGWFYNDQQYEADKPPVSGNITLTAKWKERDANSVVVTFYYNQSSGDTSSFERSLSPNTSFGGNMPGDPVYPGYKFGGWFDTREKTGGTEFTKDDTVSAAKSVYARWIGHNWVVTFNTSGGNPAEFRLNVASPATTLAGQTIQKPTRSSTEEFSHWTLDGDVFLTDTTEVTKDITVIAQYRETGFKVKFYLNYPGKEIDLVEPERIVTDGKVGALPTAPERDSHEFSGWYKDKDTLIDGDRKSVV
jgi:hypothetical protein